jgi:hypothetical protein
MYKTAALILSSFIAMQQSYAQYTGGSNDGFTNIAFFRWVRTPTENDK